MRYNFKNLVFEGGACLGVAYSLSVQELENRGILKDICRVGGTSAGSIMALLVSLGYRSPDIWNELNNVDFNKFLDYNLPLRLDCILRLFKNFGLYKGKFFEDWIKKIICKKTGNSEITFKELKDKRFLELYIIGANLNTSSYTIYSWEHSPDMPVYKAVRISMSVPLLFSSIVDSSKNQNIDGGILNNYPVRLFDKKKYIDGTDSQEYIFNNSTLGFRLSSKNEDNEYKSINNIIDYLYNLIRIIMNVQSNSHLETDDWNRTIYICTDGINGFDFNMSQETKVKLIKAGQQGIKEYFKWYDFVHKSQT